MPDPVLHVIAGPNGAGKTTFYLRVLEPVTRLEFVDADAIASERWPGTEVEHAYEAAELATAERSRRINEGRSFATETVFSYESKIVLLREARAAGYRVTLHLVLVPEDLAVARVVDDRVTHGGHHVPADKVRSRFGRLWWHVRSAIEIVDESFVYDNSKAATPFRLVAAFVNGQMTFGSRWPTWTPEPLRRAGSGHEEPTG